MAETYYDEPALPKRRGRVRKRHHTLRWLGLSVLVLSLVVSLSTVYEFRRLHENLTVNDVTGQLGGERPDAAGADGPNGPVNILVMGSDTRDGAGNNIDGLTEQGSRSDTTILMHLSADRTRAYGISIPRDSLVTRPDCVLKDGTDIAGSERAMWNEAFNQAGAACTIKQFEQTTGIRVDHHVVVDFQGFQDMVDAIGGVEVCIPETIDDRTYGIYLEAGTREISGREALAYVRERHGIGTGSDIGRIKRQQAFVASMAAKVVSRGTLANPLRMVPFLEAATKSLEVDPGLADLLSVAEIGREFQGIGLDNIQFVTVPWAVDELDPNRVVWTDDADALWRKVINDQPLGQRQTSGAITAAEQPGASESPSGSASPSESGSASPTADPEATAAAEDNGLCG